MAHGRGNQEEATNRIEEPVNFSRPFFGETHRLDHANYLSPRWSVGGISVGNYRSDVPKLGISEPNVLMPVYYLPIMLKGLPPIESWKDGRYQINPAQPVKAITCYTSVIVGRSI